MALDYFAIASNGYFPTPTPADPERMSFTATWGYFGGAPGGIIKGILWIVRKFNGRPQPISAGSFGPKDGPLF